MKMILPGTKTIMGVPKHIFFDLDNTLTESRSKITENHRVVLEKIARESDIVVVSGARHEQILDQVGVLSAGYFVLAQNGNRATGKAGELLWKHELSPKEKREILEWVEPIKNKQTVPDQNDLVEDRGCQISFSFIGHNAPAALKVAYDPGGLKRTALLAEFPFQSEDVEVKVGGTTCLDFFKVGMHKGRNVDELLRRNGWTREESVYFGDALFPGGNDESVIGIIPHIAVTGPNETFSVCSGWLV